MCGHGSIGLASAMVNLQMVQAFEPYTYVKLDTPVGLVTLKVEVVNGEAVSATLQNVPYTRAASTSFFHRSGGR